MNQFMHWLSMGGYAAYIWPAYGLVSLVLISNLLSIKAQRVRVRKQLLKWFKSQA